MSENSRSVFPVALLVAALSGCATAPAGRPPAIGLSRAALFACAGAPVRRETAGPDEYATYARAVPVGSGLGVGIGGGSDGFGFGLSLPLTGPAMASCQATVTLHDGIVTGVRYAAGSDADVCRTLLAACPPGS